MVEVGFPRTVRRDADERSAADATSHLFFAYLRSLSPQPGKTSGILGLPRSLQHLLDATTYPPTHGLLSNHTTKVVMIVDVVSPTPYALLRRAKNFEYRDDDRDLQQFASYEDPVEALTDECRRVLRAISSTNQSNVSNAKTSTSLSDPSWSRFEDIGFGSSLDDVDEDDAVGRSGSLLVDGHKPISTHVATTASRTYTDLARPTTPSWADFLSTGFADEHGGKAPAPILLPPDKILPPINTTARGQSSQSHRRNFHPSPSLDPGELASISKVDVDDAFWWVWISSLAGEEPTSRKAAFGRCALIETVLPDGQWMVMEEQVKGAAPEPAAGAYIAEKKSFLGFTTKRGRLTRRRSGIKKSPLGPPLDSSSRAPLAPDQQAKIQQAAAELTKRKQAEERAATNGVRRGRADENLASSKTNSIFTLGPLIKDEASPALKWASQYDKKAIRAQYLSDKGAGRGSRELLTLPSNGLSINRSTSTLSVVSGNKDLPAPPKDPSRSPTPLDKTTPVHSLLATPSPAAPATTAAPPPPVVVELGPLPAAHSALGESRAVKVAAEVPPAAPTSDSVKTTASSKPQTGGPAKLRKSHDGTRTSPEQKKAKKTPSGPPPVQNKTGIRRLFGTKRSKSQEPSVQQPPDSPVDADPAIAAARRALEGKPALSLANPGSPPLSPGHFTRMATAKAPFAAVHTVMEQPAAAAAATTDLSTPAVNREPSLKLGPEPGPVEDSLPVPPQTRRDEEYDQLSRVDTDEREHAAREFSTFDQGPLLEQPAFAPADTPIRDEFFTSGPAPAATAAGVRPNHHQSIYTTVPVPTVDDDDHPERTSPVIPLDRWAQIRRNAAERAAQLPEDQISRSRTETRTDDGDTSGEESKCGVLVAIPVLTTLDSDRIARGAHQGSCGRTDR